MTTQDLRLQYKKETGEPSPNMENYIKTYVPRKAQDSMLEYLKWLEEFITTHTFNT